MTAHGALAIFLASLPGLLLLCCGIFIGRRSRDGEVDSLKLSLKFLEFMAVNNAAIADKIIAEIGKSSRKAAQ